MLWYLQLKSCKLVRTLL